MADSQYSPLSQNVIRTLTDKLYEKRKSAALEIEKQVRDLMKNDQSVELERLINVLEGLAVTPNSQNRNGGLIGLAAVAIALGKDKAPTYSGKLITPVLTCFDDADQRVRYYACESLYNIVKICRSSALDHFDILFDKFWKLASDTDQNVRNGAELLDRLMKEIVVGSANFDLDQLMLLIRERIHTVNSSNRRFIISWFHTILKVPSFSVTSYIPEVVDGIFKALDDPSQMVRDTTTAVITELRYKLQPKKEQEQIDLGSLINILNLHVSPGANPVARKMALEWMNQLLVDFGTALLPNISTLLTAVLPWLHDEGLKAQEINERLFLLVTRNTKIEVSPVVDVILQHVGNEKRETRKACLKWVRHLHANQSAEMYKYIERVFPRLIDILCDQADDVLELDILLITDICGQTQQDDVDIASFNLPQSVNDELQAVRPYLVKFGICVVQKFRSDPDLVVNRGTSIIRQLCLLLDPQDVYRAFAILLPDFDSIGAAASTSSTPVLKRAPSSAIQQSVDDFISRMVGILNAILLTAPEMFQLRQKLKDPVANDCVSLFECLYRCWSHQPICLLALCLLSKSYTHAAELVPRLAEVNVSVELLAEIDRLVQLIESPILAYVRMDLLFEESQRPLATVLSALLMLVPQTDVFQTLQHRVQLVSYLTTVPRPAKFGQLTASSTGSPATAAIDYEALLAHFDAITLTRSENARNNHRKFLNELAQQKGL